MPAMLWTILTLGTLANAPPPAYQDPVLRVSGDGPTLVGSPVPVGEYSRIIGARELSDGSVLLIDAEERAILHLPRSGSQATAVGRDGSGPGEYTSPRLIVPIAGDTSAVFDQSQWRWVFLNGARMLPRTLNFATAATEQYRGFDRQGRLYYEGSEGFGAAPDSLPILRYDPHSEQTDTVARIKLPKPRDKREVDVVVGGMSGPFSRYGPYAPRDDWSVAGDGTIVIARVSPYRVDRIVRGRQTSGPLIPDTTRRIEPRDKDAWTARYGTMKVAIPEQGGKHRVIVPNFDVEWPDYMPPFEPGAVRLAPDGTAWITRTPAATDPSTIIDLVDVRGMRVGRVSLRPDLRLVGLGRTTIYLVREDEDGLQSLIRQRVTW